MGYEFDGVRYEKLRDMRETRRARYVGLFEAGMNFTRTAHAGGCPYRFVKSYQLDCVSFLGHASPCRWRLAVQAVRCMGW